MLPRKQEFEETCREEVRQLKDEMDYEQVTGPGFTGRALKDQR